MVELSNSAPYQNDYYYNDYGADYYRSNDMYYNSQPVVYSSNPVEQSHTYYQKSVPNYNYAHSYAPASAPAYAPAYAPAPSPAAIPYAYPPVPQQYAPSPNQYKPQYSCDPEIEALLQFVYKNYAEYQQTISSGQRPSPARVLYPC